MRGSPFPTGKALALAIAFAAVHYAVSHVLLFAALGRNLPAGDDRNSGS